MRSAWFLGGVLLFSLAAGAGPLSAQPIKDDPERLQVIYVELAWLSDSELCFYYPTAHVEAGTLKIAGFLPSAALRDKALKIAALVSRLPLADEVKIHPGCRFTPTRVADESLLRAAAQMLKTRFPNDYQKWQMGLRASGELLLAGPVDGYEKKLLISQTLRGLPGCKCVVNRLQAPKSDTAAAPKMTTPIKMPAPSPVLAHLQPVPATQAPSVAAASVLPVAAATELPLAALPADAVIVQPGVSVPAANYAAAQTMAAKQWQAGKTGMPEMPKTAIPAPMATMTPASPGANVKTAAAPTAKIAEIRSMIEKTAGPALTKLEVNLAGNKLSVRFSVAEQTEAERIAETIMNLPALASYWLELKVDVPR